MDITNPTEVGEVLEELFYKKDKVSHLIHTAAVTKPMSRIELSPEESIKTNIGGTLNVALKCYEHKIKFIYISSDFVYPPSSLPHSETSPNKYGWSKLGGECVTHVLPNSLIFRCALCDIPFRHKKACSNILRSSITHDDAAKIILKLKDLTGVINLGGDAQSVFDFVSQYQVATPHKCDESQVPSLTLNTQALNNILK